jgi:hypothetical protein
MDRPLSQSEYFKRFGSELPRERREELLAFALAQAEANRKLEIDLYWRRSAYFWAFIVAAMAGLGIVFDPKTSTDIDVPVLICCVGFVFSGAWFLVNRGSKQWQENWENHVDLLENELSGPLYKTLLTRPPAVGCKRLTRFLVGPGPFSVSKINQIMSLYVTILWILLLMKVLSTKNWEIHFSHAIVMALSLVTIFTCYFAGRTEAGPHISHATLRRSRIRKPFRDW